jgi:pyruvate dehydrogenase E2 component (dihydrolipoamide acetyltransferase)
MAQAVVMPKFGQMVEESSIVKWHKKEGDFVRKGEIVFEIETDKAVMEVESFFEGTLLKILVPEGVSVPVASVVGYIGKPGEEAPSSPPPVKQEPVRRAPVPAAAGAEPATGSVPLPRPQQVAATSLPPRSPAPEQPARLRISPRARALAKSSCIDPSRIRGSGPDGRIIEKDVNAWLQEQGYASLRISPAARTLASRESVDILRVRGTGTGGRIMLGDVKRAVAERPRALSKMRQVIARRLTESFTGTPHFYVTVAADMTELLAYRRQIKDQGKDYTVTDFILEAVILTLREFPVVNSVCDGRSIKWHGSVDLGLAVSLDDGLVVPVIRNAQELDMRELHETAQTLATKARDGRLGPDEMTGSTFTVSNMGMLDVDTFHAIINPGEAAILAVSSTRDRVVARNGKMEIRAMMNLTLSVDHRIVDGAVAAGFVNAVKKKLEDAELWRSLT